jgi:hypothetical protein
MGILDAFGAADDPYVHERLYAVATGAPSVPGGEELRALADGGVRTGLLGRRPSVEHPAPRLRSGSRRPRRRVRLDAPECPPRPSAISQRIGRECFDEEELRGRARYSDRDDVSSRVR